MKKIVYHIATTVDNFIARPDGNTDGFLDRGEHIPDFLESLNRYDIVLMGGKTYEYGFQFGLKPGEQSYRDFADLKHYIFSKSMNFSTSEKVQLVRENELEAIAEIKQISQKKIWLCGGGKFAGFLLEHELIDELLLKVNPVVFGNGIELFGNSKKSIDLALIDSKIYRSGVILSHYQINYK
jgi:dihydrofolate reductase